MAIYLKLTNRLNVISSKKKIPAVIFCKNLPVDSKIHIEIKVTQERSFLERENQSWRFLFSISKCTTRQCNQDGSDGIRRDTQINRRELRIQE